MIAAMSADRRGFLSLAAMGAGALATGAGRVRAAGRPLRLACSQYSWDVFYRREGKILAEHWDAALAEMAAVGFTGLEPLVESPADLATLAPLLRKHGLEVRSLYVNTVLHDPGRVDASVAEVLAVARAARPLGAGIVVTNPSPIRWGGPENRTSASIRTGSTAAPETRRWPSSTSCTSTRTASWRSTCASRSAASGPRRSRTATSTTRGSRGSSRGADGGRTSFSSRRSRAARRPRWTSSKRTAARSSTRAASSPRSQSRDGSHRVPPAARPFPPRDRVASIVCPRS